MSYVHSSQLDNNYQTPDGESLPAYDSAPQDLSADEIAIAVAAITAAHEDSEGPYGAEIVQSLFDAIDSASDAEVAHILAHFPNIVNPNSRNRKGRTALAKAVKTGEIRMVEMLINMGADVNMWSVQGEYTLHKYYHDKPWFRRLRESRGQSRRHNPWTTVPEQNEDPNAFTVEPEYHILRTPLMIAAEKGYLPIVKMLFNPPCNADHTLCAPDGQIALRLAVEHGQREVVEFLPSLRKGGFRRFKHQHAASTYRIRQITETLRFLAKVFFWYLPKALLFDFPKWLAQELWKFAKHVVTVAIPRAAKATWRAAKATWRGVVRCGRYVKNDLPMAIARQSGMAARGVKKFVTVHIPGAIKGTAKFLWKFVTVHIPGAIKGTAKFLWKFVTKIIPDAVKATGKFFWRLLTVYIPNVIKWVARGIWKTIKCIGSCIKALVTEWFPAFCKAVARGLKAFAIGTWNLLVRGLMAIASFFHTIFEAIISFFRRITLKDIWDGFVQVLRWVFVEVPTGIGKVIVAIFEAIEKGVVKVFGWVGEVAVILWKVLLYIIIYLPMKAWSVIVEYFKVLVRGVKEVLIWFNPKR